VNGSNKSKFDSEGNQEEIEFWLFLLSFGPELSVFSSAVQKRKNYAVKDYNFVYGSVWV
jgi:hypothetical protein